MNQVKNKAVQYWQHPFIDIEFHFMKMPTTTAKLIFTALLSSFAVILQSAGGFVPGIGLFMSAMTTLPIFLATIVSIRYGFLSYFVTILLLLFIQPSELINFPFTTGILGLALGLTIYKSKTRFTVILLAGITLFLGIIALLYLFSFPVLGPIISTSFQFFPLLPVAIFSLLYAWLAAEACSFVLKRLSHRVIKPVSDHLEDGSAKEKNIETGKSKFKR